MQQSQQCYMCSLHGPDLGQVLNSALFFKHTQATGFKAYYNIASLINGIPGKSLIIYKEKLFQNNSDQCLKNYYTADEIPFKLYGLLDYYSFHKPTAHCHLKSVNKILERHRHERLKAYYKEIKRQLNMTVQDSVSSNYSSEKQSSETTCKPLCSCLLCDITGINKIAKSQSKALQDIYKDIEKAKELDNEDYKSQKFMFKKSYDSSKAFETYVNACQNLDKRRSSPAIKVPKKDDKIQDMIQPKLSVPITHETMHLTLSNPKLSVVSRYASIGQHDYKPSTGFRKLIKEKLNFNYKPESKIIQFRKSVAYEPPIIRITSRKPSLNLRAKRVLDPSPETLRVSNVKFNRRDSSEHLRRTGKFQTQQIFSKRYRAVSLQTLRKPNQIKIFEMPKYSTAMKRSSSIQTLQHRTMIKLNPKKIYDRLRKL